MNNLILGSHNTGTAYKPIKWFMYPFSFFSKCQKLTIEESFKKGVRFFDLRVKYQKDGTYKLGHGLMTYDITLPEVLTIFKKLAKETPSSTILFRILHENTFSLLPSENKVNKIAFNQFTEDIKIIANSILSPEDRKIIRCVDIRSKKNFEDHLTDKYFSYINTGWFNPSPYNYLNMGYIMKEADNAILKNNDILCEDNYVSKGAWWSLFIPLPRITAKYIRKIINNRLNKDTPLKGIHILLIDFC